ALCKDATINGRPPPATHGDGVRAGTVSGRKPQPRRRFHDNRTFTPPVGCPGGGRPPGRPGLGLLDDARRVPRALGQQPAVFARLPRPAVRRGAALAAARAAPGRRAAPELVGVALSPVRVGPVSDGGLVLLPRPVPAVAVAHAGRPDAGRGRPPRPALGRAVHRLPHLYDAATRADGELPVRPAPAHRHRQQYLPAPDRGHPGPGGRQRDPSQRGGTGRRRGVQRPADVDRLLRPDGRHVFGDRGFLVAAGGPDP